MPTVVNWSKLATIKYSDADALGRDGHVCMRVCMHRMPIRVHARVYAQTYVYARTY
jgi:hypothetical protein